MRDAVCSFTRRVAAVFGVITTAACASVTTPPLAAPETDPWRIAAEDALAARLAARPNHARAKNIIVFIADGASPTLFTAARIHDGQRMGEIGDSHDAPSDLFPHTAMAKVYAANGRIPDSAATGTAIFTGVKTNIGAVGVPAGVVSCADTLALAQTDLADVARAYGRRVGVITTSTIVDATPAAVYAHAPTRRWGDPSRLSTEDRAAGCHDIPEQLVAANLDVAMGGGLALFTPEADGGARADGRDLVAEWRAGGEGRVFVGDPAGLADGSAAEADQLFALFSPQEMFNDPARTNDGPTTAPTLAAMAVAALDVLQRDDQGFVLMIEHEGTDEFQHAGRVMRALDSGVELHDAVRAVLERVDLSETLVVVTADHGQPLAFAGGVPLDAPVDAISRWRGDADIAQDEAPFATLGFYVGPHGRIADADLSNADLADPDYVSEAAVPLGVVTHSAVDVPVYAAGPWSDLFAGVMEQNVIFTILRHALEPDA